LYTCLDTLLMNYPRSVGREFSPCIRRETPQRRNVNAEHSVGRVTPALLPHQETAKRSSKTVLGRTTPRQVVLAKGILEDD